MVDDSLLGDLREIVPNDAIAHAESRQWHRVSVSRNDFALFKHPTRELIQAMIPLDQTIDGYDRRMAEAVKRFAEEAQRPLFEIIANLLARSADVLRFRVGVPGYNLGNLPVTDGINLYAGLKQAILSAVRGAMKDPQPVYSKLTSPSADEFIRNCRLGQSERGSYIATVSCPLGLMPERRRGDIPLSRLTTTLLLNTMATLAAAANNGREQDVLALQGENVVVSSNLCEAIATMQPKEAGSVLDVTCSWAPSLPERTEAANRAVFRAEHRDFFTSVARRLKKNEPDPFVEYIATILELKSDPDLAKRSAGEIIVKVSGYNRVHMEVLPADYALAVVAHLKGKGIQFKAKLLRSVRSAKIVEYREFSVLPGLPVID